MDSASGFHLDLRDIDDTSGSSAGDARPWLGIQFDCCGTYTRIYKTSDGTAYTGRCPHCLRPIRLGVGPGGTDARFFRAE